MGRDAERLVIGFSYSMVGGVISQALVYLAGVLVMRLLGPESYGLYQLVFLVPLLFTPILNLGIESTLVRFVSRYIVDDRNRGIRTARFLFMARLAIALAASLLILALSPWISNLLGEEVTLGVQITGIFLLGNMLYLFMNSFFQSFFLMRERTIVMTTHGASYLALVPLLVYLDFGYLAPIVGFSIAKYLAVAIGLILAWRKDLNLLARPSREGVHLLEQVKFAAPTYITVLLWAVFTQVGVIIIRGMGLPVVEIGYFRGVFNIVMLGGFLAMILHVVVYPYVSELESRQDQEALQSFCSLITRFLILLAIPASAGFLLVSRPTLEALLPDYLPALTLLRILSLMLVFLPLFQISKTMLLGLGKPRIVAYSSLIATATVCSMGSLLSFFAGTEGLSFSYTIGILLATCYTLYQLRKAIGLEVEILTIGKIGLSTLIMGIITHLTMQTLQKPIFQIAIGIPVGLATYLGLIYLLKALKPRDMKIIKTAVGIAKEQTLVKNRGE